MASIGGNPVPPPAAKASFIHAGVMAAAFGGIAGPPDMGGLLLSITASARVAEPALVRALESVSGLQSSS